MNSSRASDEDATLIVDKSRETRMADEINAEFESYRQTLQTEEKKRFFDEKIKHLLQLHGVDYVRGYVAGLKEKQ